MCNIFFIIHIYHKQCSVKSHLSYEGEKASSVCKKNWAWRRLHRLMDGNQGGCMVLWMETKEAARDYGGEPRRCHCPLEGNWGTYTGLGREPSYRVEHRMFHVGWGRHIEPKQQYAFLNSSELKEQSRRNVCPWAPEQIRSGWVPPG